MKDMLIPNQSIAFVKEIDVPSVDPVTTVKGLRAFVKENDVPSVDSVTAVEGLRAIVKDNLIPKQSTKSLLLVWFGFITP